MKTDTRYTPEQILAALGLSAEQWLPLSVAQKESLILKAVREMQREERREQIKPEVSTSEYEFSHGKPPRGQGQWAFAPWKRQAAFWHTGTYAEARKAAREHFAGKASIIWVCP